MRRPSRFLPLACLSLLLAGLGACADDTAQTGAAKIPPQDFPAGTQIESPPPANEAQLTLAPSAPANTPLCGTAAKEANAMLAANYPAPYGSGSACVRNACFDPQTSTYIGADGNRHVCR